MKKAAVLSIVVAAILLAVSVMAQQPTKIPRVGFLAATSPSATATRIRAFHRGLRELGYAEKKNIVLEYRYAEVKLERLSALAAELVRLNVDVFLTAGPRATRAAKQATGTIPIVMAFDSDPVRNGFVASLARPGGSITGLSALSPEISGKQLELLREIIPKFSRLTVLGHSAVPGNAQALREMELASGAVDVELRYLDVQDLKDVATAFEASKGRADAVLVLQSPVVTAHPKQFAELAAKNRLPTTYWSSEFVEAGGLMSYGVSFTDLYRRAATYVDKILKGANPADLPVEQPKKFELVINLKAAKQIGLTIPPNVLARADSVIR